MDRNWLFTWTCYGTWLPGDTRGFVGNVRQADGAQVTHNLPGTPYDADLPGLVAYTREHMTRPPVTLGRAEADAVIGQYQETARIRKWFLHAASVMYNHTHVVVGVRGDPDPQQMLETLKSWATRAVKKVRPLPNNGHFWTAKGSKRKLPDEQALRSAILYVTRKQPNPLATWAAPEWQALIADHGAATRVIQ
jgi:hypothetical protein